MARLAPLTPDRLSSEQASLYEAIRLGPRGEVPSVLAVCLRSPSFLGRFHKLGEYMRYDLSVPAALREIAILAVAAWYGAAYIRRVHEPLARKAGLSDTVIAAIAAGRTPPLEAGDEQLIYNLTRDVLESRGKIASTTYEALVTAVGEKATVELIGAIGFYGMVATILNTLDIEA